MKKLLLVSALAMMCAVGTTAMAEGTYTAGESSYADDVVNGASTVVIYKGTTEAELTDDNIYYIDQNDTEGGFSGFRALLKVGTPAGTYTVLTNDSEKTATFTVSDGESRVAGTTEMSFLDAQKQSNDDTKYSVGFTILSEDGYTSESKLIMLYNGVAYETNLFGDDSIISWNDGSNLPNIEGYTKCAIQFDEVGADYMTVTDTVATPKFTMYFEK